MSEKNLRSKEEKSKAGCPLVYKDTEGAGGTGDTRGTKVLEVLATI